MAAKQDNRVGVNEHFCLQGIIDRPDGLPGYDCE
jgi:hypothetical protein